jgi:predicted RNase H-like HicB family nuclease
MSELLITVLLERDEDDPAIYNVSVPGLPGCISTLGSPSAAVAVVQGALQRALEAMNADERRGLREGQAAVRPSELPPGARMERVLVRVATPAEQLFHAV